MVDHGEPGSIPQKRPLSGDDLVRLSTTDPDAPAWIRERQQSASRSADAPDVPPAAPPSPVDTTEDPFPIRGVRLTARPPKPYDEPAVTSSSTDATESVQPINPLDIGHEETVDGQRFRVYKAEDLLEIIDHISSLQLSPDQPLPEGVAHWRLTFSLPAPKELWDYLGPSEAPHHLVVTVASEDSELKTNIAYKREDGSQVWALKLNAETLQPTSLIQTRSPSVAPLSDDDRSHIGQVLDSLASFVRSQDLTKVTNASTWGLTLQNGLTVEHHQGIDQTGFWFTNKQGQPERYSLVQSAQDHEMTLYRRSGSATLESLPGLRLPLIDAAADETLADADPDAVTSAPEEEVVHAVTQEVPERHEDEQKPVGDNLGHIEVDPATGELSKVFTAAEIRALIDWYNHAPFEPGSEISPHVTWWSAEAHRPLPSALSPIAPRHLRRQPMSSLHYTSDRGDMLSANLNIPLSDGSVSRLLYFNPVTLEPAGAYTRTKQALTEQDLQTLSPFQDSVQAWMRENLPLNKAGECSWKIQRTDELTISSHLVLGKTIIVAGSSQWGELRRVYELSDKAADGGQNPIQDVTDEEDVQEVDAVRLPVRLPVVEWYRGLGINQDLQLDGMSAEDFERLIDDAREAQALAEELPVLCDEIRTELRRLDPKGSEAEQLARKLEELELWIAEHPFQAMEASV